MVKWFIDKENKVPLYLQLKDQIMYYISTGTLGAEQQLPPVNVLARELGINFDTVRKAYKELERDGLVAMKRGQGSFIAPHNLPPPRPRQSGADASLLASAKNLIKRHLRSGMEGAAARAVLLQACDEVAAESSTPMVIFTECNELQIREISRLLAAQLNLDVRPVLVKDLPACLLDLAAEEGKAVTVVTTGFHVNQVRQAIAGRPISVDVLITNLSQETRRRLDAFGREAKYGFICRDRESVPLYHELLRVELDNEQLDLTCCTLDEAEAVRAIFGSVDAVLASPPVFEEVRRLAPAGLPVFNVFERVDPMSLKLVKDRILGSLPPAAGDFRVSNPAGPSVS